jgi:PAS domain S-box-containing protein
MALVTMDRRYLAINRAGVALLGYPRELIIGRTIESVAVPADSHSIEADWRVLERRGVVEGERTVRTADGQRIKVQYAWCKVVLDGRDVVLAVLLDMQREAVTAQPSASWQARMLSSREIEVIGHIALGERAREIASDLGISESTVRTHVRNALRKVGARSQAQLVALVLCGQVATPLAGLSEPT